ncbi:histidine kinase [Aquisediminimonas sediminicola]|uniref:histidine kinase n=1 Tax=Alteraquisediminimonas sediminicola TaxID=2676787 RepID=UPI001C8D38C2|nr:histidine kinase [Aquisediminimonas sediminicola]
MWRFLAGGGAVICLMAAGFFFWQGNARPQPVSLLAMTPPPPKMDAPAPLETPEASPISREEKRFKRYDRDRNGLVTRPEYLMSRQKAFAKLDTDRDGKLSLVEYAVKTSAKFTAADGDKSGGLNLTEFAKTAAKRSTKSKTPRCPPAHTRNARDEEEGG